MNSSTINSVRPHADRRRLVILAATFTALAGSLALQACNTTEGVGKDIKSAGKGIEEAASDAKD